MNGLFHEPEYPRASQWVHLVLVLLVIPNAFGITFSANVKVYGITWLHIESVTWLHHSLKSMSVLGVTLLSASSQWCMCVHCPFHSADSLKCHAPHRHDTLLRSHYPVTKPTSPSSTSYVECLVKSS